MRFDFPAIVRHPVSLLGAGLTTVTAGLFLVLLLLDFLGYFQNPYVGLLLFVAVPAAFVAGLLLIALGVWLESRRPAGALQEPRSGWPVLDFRVARQRRIAAVVVALTAVNIVILSMASFGAVHYMETTSFCGEVCHTTMEPQYVAHENGAHARVPCVSCHVGPGVGALVQSKMAGTRQLWQVVSGGIPKPVMAPVPSMRPARFTCENCHSPERLHGNRVRLFREYADDAGSTESTSTITLFVRGGRAEPGLGSGIHWHANPDNQIEYVSTDATRQVIPYVRLRTADGAIREYLAPGTTPQPSAGVRRAMDCTDCHNRPGHPFIATPERAVNEAIGQGRIPREIPFIRREALAAVVAEYPDKAAALRAIAARLRERYAASPSPDERLLARAIAGTQDVWARNVFPAMNVKWGTYPNHLGHLDSPGCFRCHDDDHKSKDGRVIRQDCEICHSSS